MAEAWKAWMNEWRLILTLGGAFHGMDGRLERNEPLTERQI